MISKRRKTLQSLEEDFLCTSNAPGTRKNHCTHRKRYREFCEFSNVRPYPVTEFKISKFATYLTDILTTVESIKQYCNTVCDDNELKGYGKVRRGIRYFRTVRGIRNTFKHTVRRAQPMTVQLLTKMVKVVNISVQKEMVSWVAVLGGFNMVLRKSNLVPLTRVHDSVHNLVRSDVRYGKGVMVITPRWSKTNQLGQDDQNIPLVANKASPICPVRWILHMMQEVPALPTQNLFCFQSKKGLVPITYRDLMIQMRSWLEILGEDSKRYSTHSLRRGAASHAHDQNILGRSIQELGFWKSDCYKNYIQIDFRSKMQTRFKFNQY